VSLTSLFIFTIDVIHMLILDVCVSKHKSSSEFSKLFILLLDLKLLKLKATIIDAKTQYHSYCQRFRLSLSGHNILITSSSQHIVNSFSQAITNVLYKHNVEIVREKLTKISEKGQEPNYSKH